MRAGAWKRAAALGIAVAIAVVAWRVLDRPESYDIGTDSATEGVAASGEGEARLSTSSAKRRDEAASRSGSESAAGSAAAADPWLASFSGVVVDHRGAPLEGAEVVLAGRRAATGARGEFSLPPIRPQPDGRIGELVARKSGLGGARVAVRVETPRELRIVFPPMADVSGVVVSPAGPVPDATVTWREDAAEGDRDAAAVESRTRTSLDGAFRVPEASSARGRIYVEAAHFVPEEIDVEPGATPRRVRVALRPVGREVPTRVVDEAGAPVAGARVEVRWDWPQRRLVGVTDALGAGPLVPAVVHGVSVSATDGRGARGGAQAPFAVDEDVKVVLEQPDTVDLVVHAFGVSLDQLPSWSVALAWGPSEPDPWASRVRIDESSWTSVDRFGRAVLRASRGAVRWCVVAVRRDARGREASHRFLAWKAASPPEEDQRIEWRVPALAPLRVAVVATEDDLPLETHMGASPVTEGAPWEHAAEVVSDRGVTPRVGEDGVATVWVHPGRWKVFAQRSHFDLADKSVDVPAEGASVRLALPRGLVLRGKIRMADGTPLPYRFVSFTRGERWVSGRSDATGAFALEGALAGTYEGWFEGARGETGLNHGVVAKVPGDPVECVVVPCTIRGELRLPAGERCILRLAPTRDGQPALLVDLDELGRFEMTGLSAGDWTFQGYLERANRSFRRDVKVLDGAFFRLDPD